MSVEARVWGLKRYPACTFSRAETVVRNGPPLDDSEVVKVIELEPVLDLLERLDPEAELARVESLQASQDAKATWREVVDFLRTHGRLK